MRTMLIGQTPSSAVIQATYEWLIVTAHDEEALPIRMYFSVEPAYLSPYAPFQLVLPTEPPVEDWLKFQGLAASWKIERRAISSITEMILCPSYQSIIGMGEAALPFMIRQLELEGDDPDQWFWALRAITGADPVTDEDRGDYLRMAQSWLRWASTRYVH